VFWVHGVRILISGLSQVAHGILALLGDVMLELLLAVMAANFAGWLFFHASYFEKVNNARTRMIGDGFDKREKS